MPYLCIVYSNQYRSRYVVITDSGNFNEITLEHVLYEKVYEILLNHKGSTKQKYSIYKAYCVIRETRLINMKLLNDDKSKCNTKK